jgi:RES domain-containing protein
MLSPNEDDLIKYFAKIYKSAPGFTGICYRGVWKEFADPYSVIQASGSFLSGGRYNVESTFGVLYLSCDPKTCIEESVQSIHINPTEMAGKLPRMIVGLKVEISKVLKLSREKILNPTMLRKRDLLDLDWVDKQLRGEEIVTQLIGKVAKSTGFEAVLVPSARRDGCNLNLFPDNLASTSKIMLVNVEGLNSTDKTYDENCLESLEKLKNKLKRGLTNKEKKTLFCPQENILYG